MKILVTGSRYAVRHKHLEKIRSVLMWLAEEVPGPHELIHGGNRGSPGKWVERSGKRQWWDGGDGADAIAAEVVEKWSESTVSVFEADWTRFGSSAGPRRNQTMIAQRPDICVAFPILERDNSGTLGCVELAWRAGIPTLIYPLTV